MKNLFVILFLSVVSFVSFSQKFVIEGFEHQELISFRNTTIDSVLENPDLVNDVNVTKLTFVIDLDNQICRCYASDEFLNSCPLSVIKNENENLTIKLIDKDNDCGIVLCEENKSFLIYWNQVGMTSVRKFNKLNISKSY